MKAMKKYWLSFLIVPAFVGVCAVSFAEGVLVSQDNDDEDESQSTLVSSYEIPSAAPAAPSGGKIRIKLTPKPRPAASAEAAPSETASRGSEYVEKHPLAYSRQNHPDAVNPNVSPPTVQQVGSPNTLPYGSPRPASVLNRGRPKGKTPARVRPRMPV